MAPSVPRRRAASSTARWRIARGSEGLRAGGVSEVADVAGLRALAGFTAADSLAALRGLVAFACVAFRAVVAVVPFLPFLPFFDGWAAAGAASRAGASARSSAGARVTGAGERRGRVVATGGGYPAPLAERDRQPSSVGAALGCGDAAD